MAAPENDSLFEAPPMGEQERMVEAILFASVEPVTVKELADRLGMSQSMFLGILIEHAVKDEAWIIRLVTSKYVDPIRKLVKSRKSKSSKPRPA